MKKSVSKLQKGR